VGHDNLAYGTLGSMLYMRMYYIKAAPFKVEAYVTNTSIGFAFCLGGVIVGNFISCKENVRIRQMIKKIHEYGNCYILKW
jgi:hypothetical protein